MDILQFPPDTDDFQFSDPAIHKRKQLGGPIGFYSKDVPGQSRKSTFTWTLSLDDYLLFFTFFKAKSSLLETFLVSLPVDTAAFADYKATFRQDTFSILEQSGSMIKVSIELEIVKA